MDIYKKRRLDMAATQLRPMGIRDERVLDAMERVPRHLFVPENIRSKAYVNSPLPVGEGQTISQPYIVALMTECLELDGSQKVLEIGTGSGYQTAVLAELAEKVYTVERIEPLASSARKVIEGLGYANVEFRIGDGSEGLAEGAPYDGIMVTAGAPEVPLVLREQLSEGGKLVIPVGAGGVQDLLAVTKAGGKFSSKKISGCVFVPLIGKYGHKK